MFKVQDVHVKVHNLTFTIHDSKHDLLYKTVKPIAKRAIKRQIERVMANMLHTGFKYGDTQLARVKEGMQKARENDLKSNESRQKVLKEVNFIFLFYYLPKGKEHTLTIFKFRCLLVTKTNPIPSLRTPTREMFSPLRVPVFPVPGRARRSSKS